MLLAVAPSAALSLLTATFSPVEAIVPEWTTEEAPRPRTPPRMTSFSVSCFFFGGGGEGGDLGRERREEEGRVSFHSWFFSRERQRQRAGSGSSSSSSSRITHLVPRSFPPSAIVCLSDT